MRIYIHELIDDETKRKLKATVHRSKRKQDSKHKRNEKLSRRDVEYLMGTRRDRYHKVKGKVKRK